MEEKSVRVLLKSFQLHTFPYRSATEGFGVTSRPGVPKQGGSYAGATHRIRGLSENKSQKREVDDVVGKPVNPVTYRLEVADYPVSTDAKTLSAAF